MKNAAHGQKTRKHKMLFTSFFFFFFFTFLIELGHDCCVQAVSSCDEFGLLLVSVHGLLTEVAAFVAEHKF